MAKKKKKVETREISREERVTGKAPAGTIKALDKSSREFRVNKGDK